MHETGGWTLEIVRESAALEELRPAWGQLWLNDVRATPFQSPAWLLPWWHQFGQADLRVMVWRNAGQIMGILPLYALPQEAEPKLLLLGAGTSDYLDGVFSSEFPRACLQDGLRQLSEEGGWGTFDTMQLRPDSPLCHVLSQVTQAPGSATEPCAVTPSVRMEGLPTKIRRNFMYYRNRASRTATLRYELAEIGTWEEIWAALVSLHAARWAAKGETGVLSDPRVLAMHREAIPALLEQGVLRLGCLRRDGEIIAAMYGFCDATGRAERCQYLYLPGISMRHAEFRPGTLLLGMTIDYAASEGIQTIDMLRGDEDYKQLWHVQPAPTFGFSVGRKQFQ